MSAFGVRWKRDGGRWTQRFYDRFEDALTEFLRRMQKSEPDRIEMVGDWRGIDAADWSGDGREGDDRA